MESFRWCERVTDCAAAFAVAGVFGAFRVELMPLFGADAVVWVVVGDLPPAYLAFEEGDTWQDGLAGYVSEMQAWVDAVRSGKSIEDLIPVNVAPTAEYADMLASRLAFIRANFLNVDPASVDSDV